MYRKSLELDPASASAHYNLAASLVRSGELAEAERHFRAALAQKPSAPDLHRPRRSSCGSRAAWTKPSPVCTTRSRPTRKHPAAYDQLGTILVEQGRLDEAASNYRSLVRKAQRRRPPEAGRGPDAPRSHGRGAREMETAKALGRNAETR